MAELFDSLYLYCLTQSPSGTCKLAQRSQPNDLRKCSTRDVIVNHDPLQRELSGRSTSSNILGSSRYTTYIRENEYTITNGQQILPGHDPPGLKTICNDWTQLQGSSSLLNVSQDFDVLTHLAVCPSRHLERQ